MAGDAKQYPQLKRLGVGAETQHFFSGTFWLDTRGFMHFNYLLDSTIIATELRGIKTAQLVSTTGLWMAGNTQFPTTIYLFFSAMEAIAFFELKRTWLPLQTSALLVALGVRPTRQQILNISAIFPGAAIATVFSRDELGQICDCLVSLWLTGKNGHFSIKSQQVVFELETSFPGKKPDATFSREKLTYELFSRTVREGLGHKGKGQLRTYKPVKPFFTFLSQLSKSS